MKKHDFVTNEDGMMEDSFDQYLLFELNVSSKVAMEQAKSLAFIEDSDPREEVLYKHHMTLRRFDHNLQSFNT
jgi:hypothetical protein